MASRRIVPVPVRTRIPGTSATDQPEPATATFADLPMTIIRPYVAPYSEEFRHRAVLLTWSRKVPVSHVARQLGIRIDSLRDWIAQARHDPRQLHEGISETLQAEPVSACGRITASSCATPSASSLARASPPNWAGGDGPTRHWRPGRPDGSPHTTAVRVRRSVGVTLASRHPLPGHGCLPLGVLRT